MILTIHNITTWSLVKEAEALESDMPVADRFLNAINFKWVCVFPIQRIMLHAQQPSINQETHWNKWEAEGGNC